MAGDARRLVVHVTQSLGWGGLERVVYDLATRVDPERYRAAVISLSDELGRAEQFAAAGVTVAVESQRGLDAALPFRLARRFRAMNADLVVAHNFGRFFYAGPAARLAGVPAMYSEHSNTRPDERALWLAQPRLTRLAAAVVAVSETVRGQMIAGQGLPPERIKVVPNGIDLSPYRQDSDARQARLALGLPADARVIGHVGRLVPVKHQALLLAAFARLAPEDPKAHLVLAGDGPLRDDLAADASRRGISSRVHLLGRRDDIPEVLAAMDVFCLCSHSEGLPLAIVEAMAAGLPVVATETAGRDLVLHGKTGFLTPAGDAAALASRLAAVLTDEPGRRGMGEAGRLLARERYSVEVMAAAYADVFDRLLRDR